MALSIPIPLMLQPSRLRINPSRSSLKPWRTGLVKRYPAPPIYRLRSGFCQGTIQVMGTGYAVLLGQHGVITLGKTLAHALERAVTLEEAARTFFVAKVIGSPLILSDEQARKSFDYYHNRYGQRGKKRDVGTKKAMLTFNEKLVALDLDAVDARTVIEVLAGKLHRQGLVVAEYGQQTYAREVEHPTGLPTKPFCIAFPHADADGVKEFPLPWRSCPNQWHSKTWRIRKRICRCSWS